MERIGIIGLGLMGSALADRILAAGHSVVGFDLRDKCRCDLNAAGGQGVDFAADVTIAETILLSLPSTEVVRDVLKPIRQLLAGKRIIDTTTGDPTATAALGAELSELGIEYLDATLTGSSAVARGGELVVTVGGRAETYAACLPLLKLFASHCYHVGPWGSGARMKLVTNLILGLNRAVLAEGLAFARQYGMDLPMVLSILREGVAYSRVMDVKGQRMVDLDFTPQAKLVQHLKDVRLILESGKDVHSPMPFSNMHEGLLTKLVERGLGELDNSAVICAFDGERR